MSKEPNWYKLGFNVADGRLKSKMSLPEDFFISQSNRMFQDDFNVVKFAHEYAIAWLETEQWGEEIGEKMIKFIKKYPSDDRKVDEFIGRAFFWANGYADAIIGTFTIYYISAVPQLRAKLSCKGARRLVEQALDTKKQELRIKSGVKKHVTGTGTKGSR